jgi:tetratricopeptide (TPR) repeat protein
LKASLTDAFALQGAVTGRIAASLHLQLVRAENRRTVAERTTDPNAYDMRLHAMALLIDKITPEHTLEAPRALERSLELGPNSAEAWSELAYVLMNDFLTGWNNTTKEEVGQAEEALRKAYAIDRSVALAHFVEGWIRRVKGDHQGALDAFDEALQLDSNLVLAWVQKANELVFLGRAKEAPALVTKAIDLSPRDPDLGAFYFSIGRAYFTVAAASGTPSEAAVRDYGNATEWLQKSVQERPTTWYTRAYLISAYSLTGRIGGYEAYAAVREYSKKFKNWPLDPNIIDYYSQDKYRDANRDFKATLQELLKGLRIAKDTAGFP